MAGFFAVPNTEARRYFKKKTTLAGGFSFSRKRRAKGKPDGRA